MDEKNDSLASEIIRDNIKQGHFKDKVIIILSALLLISLIGNIVQSLYHDWQWAQFDAVIVDTGDYGGNANYVQGDNTGGIYNGESSSQTTQGRQIEGD